MKMLPKKQRPLLSRLAQSIRRFVPEGIYANLGQWHSRYLHDPDFAVFDWLTDVPGLVLDIGANRGHSALSILRHTRRMRVFSIEPNPEHRWDLSLIRLLHPLRFRFRNVAAGDTVARKILYIPGTRDLGQSAWGSLDPAEFEKDHIRSELLELGIDVHDESSFRKISTRVMPLDDLDLTPDLIKLDVEGFELQALQGLQDTLAKLQPALLIEANHPERWLPLVKSHGYEVYCFDPATNSLQHYDCGEDVVNLFCLHSSNRGLVTQTLLNKVIMRNR